MVLNSMSFMNGNFWIGVVSNPGSKLNRGSDYGFAGELARMFPEGENSVIHTVPAGMSYENCLKYLVEERGVGALALNTGDGGAHKIISQLIEMYGSDAPPILVIPGGTINVLSHSLGHRKWGSFNRPWCLTELLERDEVETQSRNLVRVEDSEGAHYGFCFANGVVTDF